MSSEWHALIALGTGGGEPCADGSRLDRGVHLRWSPSPDIAFPKDGYLVWRRRHRPPEWVCLDISEVLLPPEGQLDWHWLHHRLIAKPGPVYLDEGGCGQGDALYLKGQQTLEVRPPEPVIAVRAIGIGQPPRVEVRGTRGDDSAVIWRGDAEVAEGPATRRWQFNLWADGIVSVRLEALDLRLCLMCFGSIADYTGWERILPDPILLPVVTPGTSNAPENIQLPAATQREAGSRLSPSLDEATRRGLARAFADDLRVLLEALLQDGRASRLPASATEGRSRRTPPSLGMPTASFVALTALDPNVSRMVGLYHHDPVEDGTWDYRVVARYGDVPYPGRRVDFAGLVPGVVDSPTFAHDGVTFAGTGGMEVIAGVPKGSAPVLRVSEPRLGTVAGMHFDEPVPAVTILLASTGITAFAAWRAGQRVDSGLAVQGTATLEGASGIDAVTWTTGPIDLVGVELLRQSGSIGNLEAYAWAISPQGAAPVRALQITEAVAAAEAPHPRADGTVEHLAGVVGLDWSDPDDVADLARPVRVLVERADRGDGETPASGAGFDLRNGDLPALAFGRVPPVQGPSPGPPIPRRWIDRHLRPGWYAWRVRGIDLFGRLGPRSDERELEVRPTAAPPPPDHVVARHLDAADPYLSDEERAAVLADGPGLTVAWRWPAERQLRAPQVESGGEFRVYVRRGDPNLLRGHIRRVAHRGGASRAETDLAWNGPADALKGERLRVGRLSFEITANGDGPDPWIQVAPLTAPTERPATGPCTIALSSPSRIWTDLTDPRAFDRRVHVEPVGAPARLTSQVVSVVARSDGVEVKLADPLPSVANGDPRFLLQRGLVFTVVGQAAGSPILTVERVVQADGQIASPEAGERCTVWIGACYQAWLPGLRLDPSDDEALALGLVTVTTADGDPGFDDDPRWSRPGRGGLGERPGREGRAAAVARVSVPHRVPPGTPSAPRPPEVDGDIPADMAEPADWYGHARYSLAFDRVSGATGYRVMRCSASALFARDRLQRQAGTGPYAGGPFDDGGASLAWLAAHDAALSVQDLTADLSTHPDAGTIVAAWRAWSQWYYPPLLNKQVMALAERPGNEEAFQPAHAGTVDGPPFRDTIDGRGLGRFVYRVCAVDASGNASEWSPAFPLVEVRDVTPPKTPTIVRTSAFDNAAFVTWLNGTEPDLQEYRVWRSDDPAALADVRRLAPLAVVPPTPDSATTVYGDEGLAGLKTWYYRVAAADTSGNVSEPTPIVAVRVPDSVAPQPPVWERAAWVRLDDTGQEYAYDDSDAIAQGLPPAVALQWLADEAGLTAAVERRRSGERTWTTIARALDPLDGVDPASEAARRFTHYDPAADAARRTEYRIRLTDAAGNTNLRAANVTAVAAP